MNLDCVWIFSHDSVAVGEDGPTHQPIEHLAAMRAIPNLTVIRPADANEATEAWGAILADISGPVCLVLSRQNVPILDRSVLAPAAGLRRGAYVLADADAPDVVLVATGAEVSTALGARDLLAEKGVRARVVSMPSWELFEAQDADYRDEVLPSGVPRVSVEAGSTFGWSRYVDYSIGIDTFGASGKGDKVLVHFGISPDAVAERVLEHVAELV
jgi:transketolase